MLFVNADFGVGFKDTKRKTTLSGAPVLATSDPTICDFHIVGSPESTIAGSAA